MNRLRNAADKVGSGASGLGKIEREASGLRSALASFGGNIAATAVAALSRQLIDGGRAILDYSARLEQTKVGFTTLLGSSQLAEKHLKELQEFAKTTPFEFQELTGLSRRLQGVGVDAQKIIPLLKDIGNAASAAGASGAELDSIVLAFSQVIAKGKLSAEEVNQFAERGIPIWKILSEQLGKTKGEIIKLSEEGKISSDVFIEAFQQFSQANFGDAMAKQSKTFTGAMSNITDILQQTSATAFEPLFVQIRSLAVRFAADLDAQKGDFQGIGNTIAKYIGEGLGIGLNAAVAGLGAYLSNRIVGILSLGNAGDKSFIDPLTSNLLGGFIKPIGEAFGLIEKQAPTLAPAISDLNKELSNTKTKVDGLSSLGDKLKAEEAKKQAEALTGIINDLALRVRFFGQETEVAAVKQNLLRQGITNFNSSQAQTALSYAQTLDNLKKIQGLQEQDKKEEEDRLQRTKELGDELRKIRNDAEFDIKFPDATELDKFNRWVRENAVGFRGLHYEIDLTRKALQALAFDKSVGERNSAIGGFIQSLRGELKSLTPEILEFTNRLASLVEPLNLQKSSNPISPQDFAKEIETRIELWRAALDKEEAKAEGLTGVPGVENALKQRLEAITNAAWDNLQVFLDKFQIQAGDKLINIFADSTDFENAKGILDLYNEIIKARKATSDALGKDLIGDLDSQIRELNVELGRSAELSTADAIAKQLQTEAYKDLTPEMRLTIEARAAEADSLKAQVKEVDRLNQAHAELKSFFAESLSYAFEGDFKGFINSVTNQFKDRLIDQLSGIFATISLGYDPNATDNPVAKPIVGKLTATNQKLDKLIQLAGGSPISASVGGFDIGSIFSRFLGGSGGGSGGGGGGGSTAGQPRGVLGNALGALSGLSGGGGAGGSGGGGILGNLRNLFSTGQGGLFAPRGGSRLAGIAGGIGDIGSLVGGLIGGRAGSILSSIGSFASFGASFGPIGAGIGAAVGLIVGLFGGDPKRKKDKRENIPNLQKGFSEAFKQLNEILADIRSLRIDPDEAIKRASDVRAEIASGFGIKFESKKYRRIAQQQITSKLGEADTIITQIKSSAEIARGAADRSKRILPEFAGGTYFADYFRPNGLLPGMFDGKDNILAMISRGEMVLNPNQQSRVRAAAGHDVFATAGIPNYPKSSTSPKLAIGGIAGSGLALSTSASPTVVVQPNFTFIGEGMSFTDEAKLWVQSDDGTRTLVQLIKKEKKADKSL